MRNSEDFATARRAENPSATLPMTYAVWWILASGSIDSDASFSNGMTVVSFPLISTVGGCATRSTASTLTDDTTSAATLFEICFVCVSLKSASGLQPSAQCSLSCVSPVWMTFFLKLRDSRDYNGFWVFTGSTTSLRSDPNRSASNALNSATLETEQCCLFLSLLYLLSKTVNFLLFRNLSSQKCVHQLSHLIRPFSISLLRDHNYFSVIIIKPSYTWGFLLSTTLTLCIQDSLWKRSIASCVYSRKSCVVISCFLSISTSEACTFPYTARSVSSFAVAGFQFDGAVDL